MCAHARTHAHAVTLAHSCDPTPVCDARCKLSVSWLLHSNPGHTTAPASAAPGMWSHCAIKQHAPARHAHTMHARKSRGRSRPAAVCALQHTRTSRRVPRAQHYPPRIIMPSRSPQKHDTHNGGGRSKTVCVHNSDGGYRVCVHDSDGGHACPGGAQSYKPLTVRHARSTRTLSLLRYAARPRTKQGHPACTCPPVPPPHTHTHRVLLSCCCRRPPLRRRCAAPRGRSPCPTLRPSSPQLLWATAGPCPCVARA